MKKRLTELLGLRVVTADGARLGHVWEVQTVASADTTECRVEAVLYGTRGILERLGLKQRKPEKLAWKAVLRVHDRDLVVDHPH